MWYFYNPTAVAAGKLEFQKKWGKRELADNWRRANKTVLDDFNESTVLSDSIDLDNDSIANAASNGEEIANDAKKENEEYANDPHRPEYYLKDIPLTEEQMQASNATLVNALFNAGVIYKDRMENFPLADKTFMRICSDFPDFEQMAETYYNMFQLYSRIGRNDEAEVYRNKLISEFPEHEYAKNVSDANFAFKARYGKQVEDSLYADTYNAFLANDFDKVISNDAYAEKEYPEGANRARFMFLRAMSYLETGERDQFMTSMKSIVENYPTSTVSELAGLYVKGLKEGRLLASGKFEMGSIWERRR